MENIKIIQGNSRSEEGGRLNRIALDYMAYPIVGSKDVSTIETTLQRLWSIGRNRFSHQYAYEAQVNNRTLGMVTCYPVTVMNQLAWPTIKELFKLRKWSLVEHSICNLQEAFAMINLKEGREDEFHIGTLATLPESRGLGIGSQLIQYAENMAKLNSYHKCSLTVKKENEQARSLYEKLGYRITDSIEKKPFSLYRMVKNLV